MCPIGVESCWPKLQGHQILKDSNGIRLLTLWLSGAFCWLLIHVPETFFSEVVKCQKRKFVTCVDSCKIRGFVFFLHASGIFHHIQNFHKLSFLPLIRVQNLSGNYENVCQSVGAPQIQLVGFWRKIEIFINKKVVWVDQPT